MKIGTSMLLLLSYLPIGGCFPWETGNWEGDIFTACQLVTELDQNRAPDSPPPLAKVIADCPLASCLSYGHAAKKKIGPKQARRSVAKPAAKPILDHEAIARVTDLFERGTRIKRTKSICFMVPGGFHRRDESTGESAFVTDNETMTCSSYGSPCCEGEWRPAPSYRPTRGHRMQQPKKVGDGSAERETCVACFPYFLALGPEKTGTTDLYSRIALLSGVVGASQKETGFWNGGIVGGVRTPSLAGYGVKFFRELSHALGENLGLGTAAAGAAAAAAAAGSSSSGGSQAAAIEDGNDNNDDTAAVCDNTGGSGGGLTSWVEEERRHRSLLRLDAGSSRISSSSSSSSSRRRRRIISSSTSNISSTSNNASTSTRRRTLQPPSSSFSSSMTTSSTSASSSTCDFITGEATPYYLHYQHGGKSLVPRWLACVIPSAKLIVTLRDPVRRTYSDYLFFGILQATSPGLKPSADRPGVIDDQTRMDHIKNLTPENFHEAMQKEVLELERCFVEVGEVAGDSPSSTSTSSLSSASSSLPFSTKTTRNDDDDDDDDGDHHHQQHPHQQNRRRLIWAPPHGLEQRCDDLRKDQLERLAFYSSRPPGRLLVSLYPLHLASWIHAFPCDQLLLLRAAEKWGEESLRAVAKFVGVDPESARMAAAAQMSNPESDIKFNSKAFKLARLVKEKEGGGTGSALPGQQPPQQEPMLPATRVLLETFFAKHWGARFPQPKDEQEPCDPNGG